MNLKTYKRYAQNKQAKQQRKRALIYLAVALILVAIISGGIFAFSFSVGAKSSDPALGVATFANPDNPECPYETPLVEKATAARMETSLRLDLSDESTNHFVSLVVPSSELALLTDGRIKAASDFEIGNVIYMTGDKIGVVQSVEHQMFTPEPTRTDGRGNVFSRVIGKSERFVETMLYLYTPNEVIKTTPEHPFYVNGVWVEAQHLNPGDKIRSRTGKTIEVVRTEIVHDPQMVYSLLVEGTHNFYVGEEGLLAHNCTPTIRAGLDNIIGNYPISSGQCSQCAREIYDLFNAEGFTAQIGRMETDLPFLSLADGKTVLSNVSSPYHEFVRVGDTVYDSLTGPNGMHWNDYQNLFYDGVFSDGTIRVSYSTP
jgi:hypothetical protein